MKVLSIDPDSQIASELERQACALGQKVLALPARRMGEALARLECDREIACALIDGRIAGLDHGALLQMLASRFPLVPVVLVLARIEREAVRGWLARGARGLVLATMPRGDILRALRIVAEGGVFLPPGSLDANIADPVVDAVRHYQPQFTPRQREVLGLLAQGHETREICLRLGLSQGTVKNHLSAIFRELRVKNRVQAVLCARRLGAC
ncbi:Transcriptional regulatory protein DegU [Burkholderiales bacterium]|nr:MAG: response regulator transcription factor [Burkholderiales bacterium]CAG0993881.1 Transcriptional regulatory protein DegU [Burkholderiales bacterium]